MTRPLVVDLWKTLWPLMVGAGAFALGRWSFRGSRPMRYLLIALAIGIAATVTASLGGIVPPPIDETVSIIGGATVILCWMAVFLLGVVWAVPARSFSSSFLAFLVFVAGGLILMDAGACLYWRFGAPEMWEHTANADGGLRQSSGWTCYPASAVMLLHHYGIRASEGEMAYLANTNLFGTETYAMVRALNAMVRCRGWRAQMETTDYESLVRRGDPFIAHLDPPDMESHAIFVHKAGPEYAEVIDPLDGFRKKVSRADFEAVWDRSLVRIITEP